MKRNMSPKGQRRGVDIKHETSNEILTDFNADNDSESNIKYTSTPMQKINVNRIRRQLSAPNIDSRSEESTTDVAKGNIKTFKRRKTARSLRKERIPSAKKIIDREEEERKEKRRRKPKRRRSQRGKNDLEEREENDDSERLGKEKNSRRQDKEEDAELPIAELLRKAQENQKSMHTRYEDPIPLPELTTDTLYVQGRNGFSAVKIGNFKNEKCPTDRLLKPIHIAIKIHSFSKTVMLFCQGLLGGIALSQVILVTKIHEDTNILGQINSTSYEPLISGIFLFLVMMSLVAAMDRIDIGNLDLDNIREIFTDRFMTIVTFPLYLIAICIHLSAMKIDENVTTTVGQQTAVGSDAIEDKEHAAIQRQANVWKFLLSIIAWFFIALGPTEDLTTKNLEAMLKYAN